MSFFTHALIACALLLATAVQAEEIPLLPVYPHAEQQRSAPPRDIDEYVLALGAWQRAAGELRLAASERLAGRLMRTTYRIPDGHSPAEAHRFWLTQLQPITSKRLFSCRGRACGPSNQWANELFGISELYGLDDQQFYDALELERDGHRYTLALYTVQRGNRRIYTQLDLLALADSDRVDFSISANALLTQLQERGSVVLTMVYRTATAEPAQSQVDALVRALQQQSTLQLYIVGHAYGAEPLAQLQQRSLAYAERLIDILRQRGIAASRLQAHGLGPLAPSPRGRRDRIELVVEGS